MFVRSETGPVGAEAIIFVHGAGVAGWMWKKQVGILPSFRKIVIDLPDHGMDRARPFAGIEGAADEIAEMIAASPRGRAHLVGHSLGAKIVLEVLARHPASVSSAVVSSALVRPSALASMMNSHALNVMSIRMLRSDWIARMQARQFAFPDPDMTEAFLSDARAMEPGNLDRPISAFCARLIVPPGLQNAACPVLVTAGSREPRSMLGSVDDIARALPQARQEILAGAKHSYPWTRSQEYNGLLEQWLDAVSSQGPNLKHGQGGLMPIDTSVVSVPRAEGKGVMESFFARPRGAGPFPGLIVIHEIYGLNDNIREIAGRFAGEGYAALAVDLFANRGRAHCMMEAFYGMLFRPLDNPMLADLQSTTAFLRGLPGVDAGRIGAVGFCMGGGYALQLAITEKGMKAASIFYGTNPRPLEAVARACPVVGSYPDKDFTAKAARNLDAALARHEVAHDIKIYENTRHSFFGRQRTPFEVEASKDAWKRMLAFFDEHIVKA